MVSSKWNVVPAKPKKVYYGTILSKSVTECRGVHTGHLGIETAEGSYKSIGFSGNKALLAEFDQLKLNSYAKFEFGVALTQEHDRFINRLIAFEQISLQDDPRIDRKDFSKAQSDSILEAYNGLVGEERSCAAEFIRDYQDRVLAHCQQTGYARRIGGGCYHVVGYSVHTAVLEAALKACSAQLVTPE